MQCINPAKRKRLDEKAAAEAKKMERARRQQWLLLRMTAEETERYSVKPKEKEELPPELFMEDMVRTPFGYAGDVTRNQNVLKSVVVASLSRGRRSAKIMAAGALGGRTKQGRERIAAALRKAGGEGRIEREKHRTKMR